MLHTIDFGNNGVVPEPNGMSIKDRLLDFGGDYLVDLVSGLFSSADVAADVLAKDRGDVVDVPGDMSPGFREGGGRQAPASVCCDPGGIQIITQPAVRQRLVAGPGRVIVTMPSGQKVAMVKEIAKQCGYWKEPTKPFMTGSDVKCLNKAGSLVKKFDGMAKRMNRLTGMRNMKRETRSSK